jgi:LuxR family maltose regulon positive regulatory protein
LLRSHLEQVHPNLAPTLHQRAGEWYESEGLIAEAVSHILATGDVDRMVDLVEGKALAIMDRGDLPTLVRWLEALSDETVRTRPWLCIAYAWVLAYSGQVDTVEPMLLDAERSIKNASRSDVTSDEPIITSDNASALNHVQGQRLAAHMTAIRAYVAAVSGNMSRAAILAREAMKHLSTDDLMARGVVAALLSAELQWLGHLKAAAEAYADAFAISRAAENSHVAVTVLCSLAALQITQGQLRKAADTCQNALRLAEKYSRPGPLILPVMGLAYTRLSVVLCEWNDLEDALHHAREGLELCKQWGQADILITGHLNLARVLQAIGDADGAFSALWDARQVASNELSPYRVQVETLAAKLHLAQGNITAASRWANGGGLSPDDEFGFANYHEYTTLARLLIAQSRQRSNGLLLEEALGLLIRILEMSEAAGAGSYVVEILVLQTIVLQEQGKVDNALTTLGRALILAEPEGFVRHFIDEGASMRKLLHQAAEQGILVAYVGELLAALEQETREGGLILATPLHALAEPLSKRELEILRLLTTQLSSTEIAEALTVSANTVRFHIKNIYSKLNVHRRADAVQRAKELKLV